MGRCLSAPCSAELGQPDGVLRGMGQGVAQAAIEVDMASPVLGLGKGRDAVQHRALVPERTHTEKWAATGKLAELLINTARSAWVRCKEHVVGSRRDAGLRQDAGPAALGLGGSRPEPMGRARQPLPGPSITPPAQGSLQGRAAPRTQLAGRNTVLPLTVCEGSKAFLSELWVTPACSPSLDFVTARIHLLLHK